MFESGLHLIHLLEKRLPLLDPALAKVTVEEETRHAQNSGTTGEGDADGPEPAGDRCCQRKAQAKTGKGNKRSRQHGTGDLVGSRSVVHLRNHASHAQPVGLGDQHRTLSKERRRLDACNQAGRLPSRGIGGGFRIAPRACHSSLVVGKGILTFGGAARQIRFGGGLLHVSVIKRNKPDSRGDSMMRRTTQDSSSISTHSAHSTQKFDAELVIAELVRRVARLETALENGVGPIDYLAQEIPTVKPKKRGPKPIHFQGFLADRDTLVRMFENHWPELEPLCWPKSKAKSLLRVLEAISAEKMSSYAQAARRLIEQFDSVLKFLASDRFRHDPRQIANALAGVPQVGLWRSLKLGQSRSCTYPIGQRAMKAYLKRKHPMLYRRLAADPDLLNFVSVLRSYRTKDRWLAGLNAQYLHQCWQQAKPNYRALGLELTSARKQRAL